MSGPWTVEAVRGGALIDGTLVPADLVRLSNSHGGYWNVWVPMENTLHALILVPTDEITRRLLVVDEVGPPAWATIELMWVDAGDDRTDPHYDQRGVIIENGVAVRQSHGTYAGEIADLIEPHHAFGYLRSWGSLSVIDSAFLAQERAAAQ